MVAIINRLMATMTMIVVPVSYCCIPNNHKTSVAYDNSI